MNNDKLIDMHIHTTYSDGEYTPDEVINMAINKNVKVMAITDHDTVRGIKSVDKNKYPNIKIINGIELSAKVDIGQMHILGYDIDIYDKELTKKLDGLMDNKINFVLSIIEQIKRDYDIRFSYEDIKNLINADHIIGRPDIAILCMKYGHSKTMQEAFDKYLNPAKEKINHVAKGLSYYECLNLVLNSNGIPVLAHPKSLKLSEKEFLVVLKDLINNGLMGIEVYHSSHTNEEMKYYLEIANKFNLLISGGSDFHGPIAKPNIELGTGRNNNIHIKSLTLLNKIKSVV